MPLERWHHSEHEYIPYLWCTTSAYPERMDSEGGVELGLKRSQQAACFETEKSPGNHCGGENPGKSPKDLPVQNWKQNYSAHQFSGLPRLYSVKWGLYTVKGVL